MRDLAHMVMFEVERTGGHPSRDIVVYAAEGIKEWEGLLAEAESGRGIAGRMVIDGFEFYTTLVTALGDGVEMDMQMHLARGFGQARMEATPRRKGRFANMDHLRRFMKVLVEESSSGFDNKYF